MKNQKSKPTKRANLEEEINKFNEQNKEIGTLAQMKFPKGNVLVMITPPEKTFKIKQDTRKPSS